MSGQCAREEGSVFKGRGKGKQGGVSESIHQCQRSLTSKRCHGGNGSSRRVTQVTTKLRDRQVPNSTPPPHTVRDRRSSFLSTSHTPTVRTSVTLFFLRNWGSRRLSWNPRVSERSAKRGAMRGHSGQVRHPLMNDVDVDGGKWEGCGREGRMVSTSSVVGGKEACAKTRQDEARGAKRGSAQRV